MEKRVLLAIFLSFLVLVVYQRLMPPPPEPQTASPSRSPSQAPPRTSTPATPSLQTAPPAPAAFAQPLVAGEERDVVVETSAVTATFATRQAVLKSWRLKRYNDGAGQPLELVPQDLAPEVERPFALAFADPQDSALAARAIFLTSVPSLDATSDAQTVAFEYRDANGLAITKSFSFDPAHPYVVSFSVRAERSGKSLDPVVHLGAIGPAGHSGSSTSYVAPARAIIAKDADGDAERIGAGDLAKPDKATHTGAFPYAGADEHYFISALVRPQEPVRVEYRAITGPAEGDKPGRQLVAYSARFPSAASNTRLFIGPKDFDQLQRVDPLFVRAIDFGKFRILVVPLLDALKWINAWAGNYGLSIIILTVLINAAMFPLRHKSVVSMRKMQEIQPEVKAIQDRYAKLKMSDPKRQQMNAELMNLYRAKGANPASGCIPMLLTFPVLIAFYSLLSVAIELRGAPFAGWIRDLSQPDPLYITPILMGATMVWQQRLTPMTTADPVQQKMMMFMPIMFTVFFLWAPSGLVLYWFVSNVWAIGQQLVTNRIIGPPRVHAVRPAAERRVKRVGEGKTDQAESGGQAS